MDFRAFALDEALRATKRAKKMATRAAMIPMLGMRPPEVWTSVSGGDGKGEKGKNVSDWLGLVTAIATGNA